VDAPNDSAWRPVIWGLPAALIVAGSTLRDFAPAGRFARALAVVGDASYALYLFHSFPVRAVTLSIQWSELDVAGTYWLFLAIAVAGAITLAIAIHYIVEAPVTRALRQHVAPWDLRAVAPAPVGTGEPSR
jgi:peptidoglycan/LPS O-acetylase OafA/YrhL